jgi:hypothetical protein
LLSWAYIRDAMPSCFRLLLQRTAMAFDLALLSAGRSIPARIAMIAITTSSSIRVKAAFRDDGPRGSVFMVRTGSLLKRVWWMV